MKEPIRVANLQNDPKRHGFSAYEKLLVVLFVFTLPALNAWVRGDGIGYYAYVRALLIQGNLRFEKDWLAGNSTFLMHRVDASGQLKADQYTPTGYLDNHFSVGPAILWAPFLVTTHAAVQWLDRLGAEIPADGFSRPYRVAMAGATALYGFLGLWFAFRLAREYFEECWAFLATLGIWFASSLPVYMYFNPSWSHAHSAFAVGVFLWYWHSTRGRRTLGQWALLGALSGLMVNVYYVNGALLLVPLFEALAEYARVWQLPGARRATFGRLLSAHALYLLVVVVTLLPTLVTRQIIYGSPLRLGYEGLQDWFWTSPSLGSSLFSSNHGLLSWTPILIPATVGLLLFWKRNKAVASSLLITSLAFSYIIASYPSWHGLSSYGNRFFVSLTPIFVLGLATSLEGSAALFARRRSAVVAIGLATGLFVAWNVGFVFQWGTHMVSARGPISWREMVHNQLAVVPRRASDTLKIYLVRRKALMERIEQQDVEQLRSEALKGS